MMKWRRNKTCQSTNSNIFFDLRFSRFKNAKGSAGHEPELEPANKISPSETDHDHGDGFYWRISFDKESDKILHNSDHKLNVSPVSYGCVDDMIFNGRKMQELIDEDRKLEEEWQNLNNIDEKNQRKSVHVRRRSKQYRKSPRTVAKFSECESKGVEDLMKTKKRVIFEDAFRTGVEDSFAIVKSSFDPQRDFRDSMMEMMTAKEIREREELEELLACYLTLNCDEYHRLIVKVFREVWFELKQRC